MSEIAFGLAPRVTRREAMRSMISAFSSTGVSDPSLDARLLLCAMAEIDHVDLIRDPDAVVDDDAIGRLEDGIRRRLSREPVSRILGKRGFWSLDLEISPDVLDPRADSETLVDAALELFADKQGLPLRIADLGVGSGALMCALLEVFQNARGIAVDISVGACETARRNLRRLGFESRCEVRVGEWSAAQPGRFDLLVSNPPYIRTSDIPGLDPEVRNFDPALALDGGEDGLDAYRKIFGLLPRLLTPEGVAILEIGFDQAEAIEELARDGRLRLSGFRRDIGGQTRAAVISRVP